MKTPRPQPRYRFCWWCSRKLWNSQHATRTVEGREVIVHAGSCARAIDADRDVTARPQGDEEG